MSKTSTLNTNSIGIKILVAMIMITVLIIALAAFNFVMNDRVQTDTRLVMVTEFPSAINSFAMVDEIGDMNSNILEYVLGEQEERDEFEDNREEFVYFLQELKAASPGRRQLIVDIELLFSEYTTGARSKVFDRYNPEAERWAVQRVTALTTKTGRKLELLLDQLKQSEIDDVGSKPVLEEVIYDDLPGVSLYLELVDEAGDMLNDLKNYVEGSISARQDFVGNSQEFEEFLEKLKPLEEKDDEIENLKTVEALYRVVRDGGFEVFDRYNPDDKARAIEAIDDLEHRLFSRLEDSLEELADGAKNNANTALLSLGNLTQNNQLFMSGVSTIVVIACLFIAFFSYRTISRPLGDLANSVRRLAADDIEVEIGHQIRKDEIGDVAKAMEVFKDNIIQRNKAQALLMDAKERAEAASTAKASFLATMSHEIRTPMNGVVGMIDLLMTSNLAKDQKSMVNTIRDSSFSLLGIINDILDFSKIEAGKVEIENVKFSLFDLIDGVCDTLNPNAQSSNVIINLYTDPKIPENLYGDPVRVRQVLFNIIGNAIKFSAKKERKGYVNVLVESESLTSESLNIKISIKDNGIGIHPEQLKHLFEPFTQAESSTTRQYGGTGLGLAISRNLVMLMGGTLDVESEYGESSTFTLRLSFDKYSGNLRDKYQVDTSYKIINTLVGQYSYYLEDYLTYFNYDFRRYSLEKIQELSDYIKNNNVIIITDSYEDLRGRLSEILNVEEMSHVNFYIILQQSSSRELVSSHNSFYCYPPIKISSLIYGCNVLCGAIEEVEDVSEVIEEELSSEDASDQGKLVLVAEDNRINQDVIKRQLTKLGYACIIANDGIEAEELYLRNPVNLILTDCHMPRRDGYELTQVIRQHQSKTDRNEPIIAITANALLGENEKCLAVGMDDYLAKPIELKGLKSKLTKWTKSKENHSPVNVSEGNESAANIKVDNALLDDDVIESIFDSDMEDYHSGLQLFLDIAYPDFKHLISELKSCNDLQLISQKSHSLKSSARLIGAKKLADLCEEIEYEVRDGDDLKIHRHHIDVEKVLSGTVSEINCILATVK